jgi:hypothetical protein
MVKAIHRIEKLEKAILQSDRNLPVAPRTCFIQVDGSTRSYPLTPSGYRADDRRTRPRWGGFSLIVDGAPATPIPLPSGD